jgi:hypothetical protein
MHILFLSNRPAGNTQAATVTEYLDALVRYSHHQVTELSMLRHFPARVDLNRFDAVITHYSLSLGPLLMHYIGPDLVERLKNYRGLKVAFLQDEYREIQTYWRHLNELGIDLLFSCVPEHEIPKVYPVNEVPKLRVVNVLTGYVSESLLHHEVAPVAQRPIDVGYRTRKMPYWLGRLGFEKTMIADEFERRAKGSGLVLDFSTQEGGRLYGDAWTNFVASCRSVIGVESGASIIDFDGKLERRVEDHVARNPKATFDEVAKRFLEPYEGSLELHQISPRAFEAAALRTPMVLFEGRYSGVLEPGRHFIVLRKDFSNFDEVLAKLRDHDALQAMADRTYHEVALNPRWSYRTFIEGVDRALDEELARRATRCATRPYTSREYRWAVRLSVSYLVRRRMALLLQSVIMGMPMTRKALFGLWEMLPRSMQQLARPLARAISR